MGDTGYGFARNHRPSKRPGRVYEVHAWGTPVGTMLDQRQAKRDVFVLDGLIVAQTLNYTTAYVAAA